MNIKHKKTFSTFLVIAYFSMVITTYSATINSFTADKYTAQFGDLVNFNWSTDQAVLHRLYFTCDSGITVTIEGQDTCGRYASVGNTYEVVKIVNTTSSAGKLEAELRAYRSDDILDYESKKVSITALSSQTSGDSREYSQDNSSNKANLEATIRSFTLSNSTVTTTFKNGLPIGTFTAYFQGDNVDNWYIKLSCPLPTTINGIQERIDRITSKAIGVSSPSKEGENCNVLQTASPSLKQFTLDVTNPFANPQQVYLMLKAKHWDGTKYINGETQTKTITVLPL